MGDFFQSKFMVDLKEGKLPAVQIDNSTIFKLGAMLVIVVITYHLLSGIIKHA